MRSCHRGLASAGTRLDVSQSERLAKTSGALSASVWPIIPPMDSPTQCVRAIPSAFSSARASSASWSSVYAARGASVVPWPRVS
jgi:hypothetical protein